ncbi:L-asparaginase [Sporothrix schenckii 1099-18]|uniref:L-asparaginase n=1 Tax=Sporothrix schenckii 1099-18 TaxID=1397361 RepID=A0A0F2M4W5_SPOSC|nr:L-asparaginase [Sporothrix schenckii 1099-18]KJR84662.1 L-asparaginase [Sporothrix schenckii 1099-18]
MNGLLDKTSHRQHVPIQPRIIIHGGAGNISRTTLTPERRIAYRAALKEIITRTKEYMASGTAAPSDSSGPTALEMATFAIVLLEDCPLFNSGHGAVFTRDGINELEAGIMVSRGRAKRGVGVMGLRRGGSAGRRASRTSREDSEDMQGPNIDSGAQGHAQIYGAAAEALATRYGLPLVDPSYFFTQQRWDEHIRALEAEKQGRAATSSWSASEYLPQGTCGAVALDADGVVCCATSTGGLTNKVTGRVGDTPVVGAGSWAGTWAEDGDPTGWAVAAARTAGGVQTARPVVELSRALCNLLADCLPIPSPTALFYEPLSSTPSSSTKTTRSIGLSGTGNGDSFLRISAAHTVAAMAQYKPLSLASALSAVAGPGGLLQQSAGDRWGRAGEGEGGIIGVESVVVHDDRGHVREVRTAVIQDYNSGGMFRAWVDDAGEVQVRIFRDK